MEIYFGGSILLVELTAPVPHRYVSGASEQRLDLPYPVGVSDVQADYGLMKLEVRHDPKRILEPAIIEWLERLGMTVKRTG